MSKDKGFTLLWRDIFDDDIWDNDQPKDVFSCFVYLISHANYQKANVYSKPVARGQHWTSLNKLSAKWHIGKRKVKEYLNLMAEDGKIEWQIMGKGIMITILNYNKYQNPKRALSVSVSTDNNTNSITDNVTDTATDSNTQIIKDK